MASCNWEKFKTAGDAKAMFRHCAADERLTTNHSNKEIDTSKTYLNMGFGALETYEDACKTYDSRMAELDAVPKANKRKDRVTLLGLSIPAPDNMPDDVAREWFVDVYEIMCERFGDDNMVGGSAHFDEKHTYIDKETGKERESRSHLHVYAIPVADGRLNAKAVVSKAAMIQLNNRVEAMTAERYPGYKFQTGTKRKSYDSVEGLKHESNRLAAVRAAEEEAARIIEAARARADAVEAAAMDVQFRVEQEADALRRARSDLEDARTAFEESKQDFIDETEKSLKRANNELTERKAKMSRVRMKDGKSLEEHYQSEKQMQAAKLKQRESNIADVAKQAEENEVNSLADFRKKYGFDF